MHSGGSVTDIIGRLAKLFAVHVDEPDCLNALVEVAAGSRAEWRRAKSIFDMSRVRYRSVQGAPGIELQCRFESMCAKTLYNMSDGADRFDASAPFFVVPLALALASELGIDHAQVIDLVIRV